MPSKNAKRVTDGTQHVTYTARFSLHEVHGSQCTKEYYTSTPEGHWLTCAW